MTSPVRAPRPTPRPLEIVPAPARSRRPDLRVVPQPVRARRTGAIVAVATVVVFGSLLASALFHSVLAGGQLRLDGIDRQVLVEREELRRDQLALAKAQSPERIAARAAQLGFVPGDGATWLAPEGGDPVPTGPTVERQDGSDATTSGDDATTTDERAAGGTTTDTEGAA